VDELPEEFYEALPDMITGLTMAQDEENRRAQQDAASSQRGHYPGSMAG